MVRAGAVSVSLERCVGSAALPVVNICFYRSDEQSWLAAGRLPAWEGAVFTSVFLRVKQHLM